MQKQTPLVVGNWKMNPATAEKAQQLYKEIRKKVAVYGKKVSVGVCPPYVYVPLLSKNSSSSFFVGVQDISQEKEGAHTGEVGVGMIKSLGVTHTIVGHSERRALGESDALVAKKAQVALAGGLTTIVCVGEKSRDTQGHYFNTVEAQLKSLLSIVEKKHLPRLVIAYEPVWAIGTGKTPTPEDVQEMKLFIQKTLAHTHGRDAVKKVRILYGGSVTTDNTLPMLEVAEVDGFLVGGASLKAEEFAGIVRISSSHGNQ